MTILITKNDRQDGMRFFEATCGKVSAYVFTGKSSVTVCCKNASHKCWKGLGKTFPNFEEAIANYKSQEMKAIIQAAIDN